MAHNRTSQYSAPYRRNNLLGLHQYAASDNFTSLGMWDRSKTDDMFVVKGTSGRSEPVAIIVVGAITSDRASLQPHGSYNPEYTTLEEVPKKARLQFYISTPADDPDFSADYALALKCLKAIQDEVACSPDRRYHFIEGQSLKMNFLLFREKEHESEAVAINIDNAEDNNLQVDMAENVGEVVTPSSRYEVASPYKDTWDIVSKTHDNAIMEVYGVDELPVNYRTFHKALAPGTTVSVSFTLKHYSIREKGSVPASDTFTALVESVSILKAAERRHRPGTTPKRRPIPAPQLPSRGTLKMAADTFSPIRTLSSPETPIRGKPDRRGRGVSPLASRATTSSVHSESLPSEGSSRRTESELGINEEVASLLSRDIMSLLYPLLLREAGTPSSRSMLADLLARQTVDRPTSPTVSSSSTASSNDDAGQATPVDAVTGPSTPIGNRQDDSASRQADAPNPGVGDVADLTGIRDMPDTPSASELTAVSTDDERTDPVDERSDGKDNGKGRAVSSVGNKSKRKKTNH